MKRNITRISIVALLIGLAMPKGVFAADNMAGVLGLSDTALAGVLVFTILVLLFVVWSLSKSIDAVSRSIHKQKTTKGKGAAAGVLVGFLMLNFDAMATSVASSAAVEPKFVLSDAVFWVLITIILVLLVTMLRFMAILRTMLKVHNGESLLDEETSVDTLGELGLTDAVAIEEEDSIMMDHEYDGIRELDNNLPPWWVYMFYATIIFAVVYIVRYHITDAGKLSIEEYQEEMVIAEAEKAAIMEKLASQINEDNVTLLEDEASLNTGAEIFKTYCATCHGALGEGGAGPNLTDAYWKHGGSISEVFTTIKYGVPAKGMIPWEDQLGPQKMQQVASFILSLKGSNPPNAKAPEGVLEADDAEQTETNESDSLAADVADTLNAQ